MSAGESRVVGSGSAAPLVEEPAEVAGLTRLGPLALRPRLATGVPFTWPCGSLTPQWSVAWTSHLRPRMTTSA